MLASLIGNPVGFIHFLLRYLHVFFAVIWIGHLYYFNFVQGAFMAETEAGAKSQVLQKLLPRALWWFRYGALGTFLTGFFMLAVKGHLDAAAAGGAAFASPYWISILTGALIATLMFLNVWLIIWPKQKIVIANALATATGGQANPDAPAAAAKALLASRTNTLFSIPMIFFMLAAGHVSFPVSETSRLGLYYLSLLVLIGALQFNGMYGKTGPITTIKGVITGGFALLLVQICLISLFV
jgi:uncharacterized membrane protein